MPSCFVIMPITTPAEAIERYGGDANHFAHVLDHLFLPAIESAGYEPIRPSGQGADLIQAEIVKNLETADVVLCDISGPNANVFFELGIRTALDRAVCIVRDDQTSHIPFDTGIINTHTYQAGLHPWQLEDEIEQLSSHITSSAQRADGRNALWRYFGLTQRGSGSANAVGDDPQQSALELIMNELQQLRRERSGAEPEYVRQGASAFARFFRTAGEIVSDGGGTLRVKGLGPDHIIFDREEAFLSSHRRALIEELGQVYGFHVTFTDD